MFCRNCGNQVERDKKFCKNCGTLAHEKNHSTVSTVKNPVIGFIKKRKWIIITTIVIAILIIFFVWALASDKKSSSFSASNAANPQESVVDILCDNGKGGSGTIFTTDGTVLTNNHVIVGAGTCKITIPDQATGQIAEIYEAAPVITPNLSAQYDVATLKIDGSYTDTNGKTWGDYPTTFTAFVPPSTCDPSTPSKLGDAVRIFGYPVTSGGYNLTITDGVISSFADNGKILTSAQIDSGNSGGLAIDQDGCWLGIPSAVVAGNYQSLGVIIPGAIVKAFLSNVPVKTNPAANIDASARSISAETAATPQETNDQKCQDNYGSNSQSSGRTDSSGSPTCTCVAGYTWDATGNGCAARTALQNECLTRFGSGSYSYTENGKAVCGCSAGYVMSADQSTCIIPVVKNGYQVCSDKYPNATWDGTYTSNGSYSCACQTGYTWDSGSQSCQ